MKYIIFIKLILTLLICASTESWSAEKDSVSEKQTSVLVFKYSKKSMPIFNDFNDNLKQDGNNFLGYHTTIWFLYQRM